MLPHQNRNLSDRLIRFIEAQAEDISLFGN